PPPVRAGEPAGRSPRHAALRRREQELRAEHGAAWADLGPGVRSYEFRRGFAEAARMTAGNFLRHAGPLVRPAPLHRVRLTGVRPHLDRLVGSPYLARLTALDLTSTQLGDAGAEALAACPHLAGLRMLVLAENEIGDAGAEALAASPHLGRLRHL